MKKNVNDTLKQDAFLREIAEDCKNDQLKSPPQSGTLQRVCRCGFPAKSGTP